MWVQSHGTDSFLVVRESLGAAVRPDVPEPDHLIVGARNDLRFVSLTLYRLYRVLVACQHSDSSLRSNVPHSRCGVSATRDQQVEFWVQGATVNPAQVTVVLPHDFVLLEVPTLYLFVFTD